MSWLFLALAFALPPLAARTNARARALSQPHT